MECPDSAASEHGRPVSRRRVLSLLPALACGWLALWPAASARPADDAANDMKGFSPEMVRREQARRAVERGRAFLADKALRPAREEFLSALKLVPDDDEARLWLGRLELLAGNHRLALEHFLRIYRVHPSLEPIRLELARTCLAMGRCAEARHWLDNYLAAHPDSGEGQALRRQIERCQEQEEDPK